MNLRPAMRADLPVIAAWEQLSFDQPWSATAWADEIDHHWVRLVETDRPVGVVSFSLVADTAELRRVIVAPETRRQGVGARLVEAGLAWVKSQGGVEVFLEVEAVNGGAIGLYEAVGFTRISQRSDYYGPGRTALIYRWSEGDR